MRDLINIVTEAPIADMSFQGPNGKPESFSRGTSFDARDRRLLQSVKAREKIIRMFARTPHIFEVIFINTENFNADTDYPNENIDNFLDEAGIFDNERMGVSAKPGVITVLMAGNLSALTSEIPKMPMNGWTTAHKIAHSFNDFSKNYYPEITRLLHKIDICIKDIIQIKSAHPARHKLFNYPNANSFMTMKSARDNNIAPGEEFAEIIAQYLIAGRVTMKVPEDEQYLVDDLNATIYSLFEAIVGKIIVEL